MKARQPTSGLTCYSPTLNVYVSIDNSGLIRHNDGSSWNQGFRFPDYKAESLYWDDHCECFVLFGHYYTNKKKIKISTDGLNWIETGFICPQLFTGIKSLTSFIEEENREMKKNINEMQNKIDDLEEKLIQIFYAPGMPGALEAQEDFEECVTKN
jgi:hypothetical protein